MRFVQLPEPGGKKRGGLVGHKKTLAFCQTPTDSNACVLNYCEGCGDCGPSLDLGELVGVCRLRIEPGAKPRSAGRT